MATKNADEANAIIAVKDGLPDNQVKESTPAGKDPRTTAKTYILEIKDWASEGESTKSIDFFDLSNPLADSTSEIYESTATVPIFRVLSSPKKLAFESGFQPAMNRRLRSQLRNGKPLMKGKKSLRKKRIFLRKLRNFNKANDIAKDSVHFNALINELLSLSLPVANASEGDKTKDSAEHDEIMNERKKEDMIKRQQEEVKKAHAARSLKQTLLKELISTTGDGKGGKRKAPDTADKGSHIPLGLLASVTVNKKPRKTVVVTKPSLKNQVNPFLAPPPTKMLETKSTEVSGTETPTDLQNPHGRG